MLRPSTLSLALTLLLSQSVLFAQGAYNRVELENQQQQNQASQKYPFDPKSSAPSWVQEQRFKMSIDEQKVDDIRLKKERYDEVMNNTFSLDILQRPVYKPFKTIDTIFVHPEFMTTIIFPKEFIVSSVVGDTKGAVRYIDYDKTSNYVKFQPRKNFTKKNYAIVLTNKKENLFLQIFIVPFKKTYQKRLRVEDGNYRYANEYLSTLYRYYKRDPLDFEQRSSIIEQLPQLYPGLAFEQDGDYYPVQFNNIIYFVIRDDRHGNIFYRNRKLRITERKDDF